jgi:photosystem II stability/assembly factor-like uncharacterized protein
MRVIQAAMLSAVLFCASLTAAPSDKPVEASNRAAVKLARGNGLVIARIVASRSVTQNVNKWQVMVVRNVATRKKHRLVDRSPRASVQSVFVAALPPGQYEMLEVGAVNFSYRKMVLESADFDPKLFTFAVEAQRATNLGSLIYLRPYNPVDTRRFLWTFQADSQLPSQVAYLLDDAGKSALSGELLGWSVQIGRGALTAEMKHLSMRLAGRVLMPDGSMLCGENFGQIAKRDASGHWTWEETGIIDTIQAAVATPDGTMYAVADDSVLMMREAGGTWRRIDVPLPGALPRYLFADQDRGLFTVWEQDEAVTVLVASDPKHPAWTTTRTIRPGTQLGGGPVRSFVWSLENRVVIAVSTAKMFSNQYDLHIFDTVKNEWSQATLRAFGPLSAWPDGTIYSMTGPNARQTFKTSTDWGETWESGASMTLAMASQPFFRTRLEGYLIRFDGLTSGPALWRTLDGGRTFERHADLPGGATVIALAGEQMLIVTPNGKMYFSPDNGKTLREERDSTQTVF